MEQSLSNEQENPRGIRNMNSRDGRILHETIVQACVPLTKEELIPAAFASIMSYCEEMNWTFDQSLEYVTETFGWINKLKVSGQNVAEAVMKKERRNVH